MTASFKFGKRSLRCLEGVHPDLVRVAHHALKISAEDFGVHCGLRTHEEQRILVRLGKSRTMKSRHLTGHAIDVHPWRHGVIPWNNWAAWERLADTMKAAARQLGVRVEWGGDWSGFRDGPHFQLNRKDYP